MLRDDRPRKTARRVHVPAFPLQARGPAFWHLTYDDLQRAFDDYQRGTSFDAAVMPLRRRAAASGRSMKGKHVRAEWREMGLYVDRRPWLYLRSYQWMRITTMAKAYRLPYWAIIYAALRAAEKVGFEPLTELVEAGLSEAQLRSRMRWDVQPKTESVVERLPHRIHGGPRTAGLWEISEVGERRSRMRELLDDKKGTRMQAGGRRRGGRLANFKGKNPSAAQAADTERRRQNG